MNNRYELREIDFEQDYSEINEYELSHEEIVQAEHKRDIRKLLEKKIEERRLRANFDELDGEFDWQDYDK